MKRSPRIGFVVAALALSLVALVLFNSVAMSVAVSISELSSAASVSRPGFVYAEGDRLMLDGAQFVMKGFNYMPRDYGWTNMMDWNWTEVDQEFALGASLYANTLRTGMNYASSTGNLNWKKDIFKTYRILPGYLDAMDHLLSLADKHGLKVVMWLPDDIPWELGDPVHFSVYEKFLESLMPRFANDTRIAAWDLATDMDGSWLLSPPTGAFGVFPWVTRDNMVRFLGNVAQTLRKLDRNHLLTVGFCWPSSSLLVQDFTDFLMPQFLGGDYPNLVTGTVLGQSESYVYDNWDWTSIFLKGAAVERLETKVKSIQNQMIRPMPLVLAEIGLFSCCESSLEIQRAVYDVVYELAFVRMKLAGALYWVLTDFTWPPKTDPFWGESFVLPETEKSWGVFMVNYTAKPAAEVVAEYCEDHPTILFSSPPSELKFVFSKAVVPEGEDTMPTSAKFDWIQFRDADGRVLYTLDIGTPEARHYLESQYQEDWKRGFWPDRGPWNPDYGDTEAQNFAFVGGPEKETSIFVPFPSGTRSIAIRVAPVPEDMSMDVFVEGESVARLTLGSPYVWQTYNVTLPPEKPLMAGDTLTIHGLFKIPISDGTVTLQVSSDQQSWSNVTTSVPVRNGRFSAPIKFAEAGNHFVRAVWSGRGDYLSSTSNTVTFEVGAKPVTVVTTSTTVVSSPAAASLTPDILTLAGVGIVVGIVIVAVAFLFMRRRTKSHSV